MTYPLVRAVVAPTVDAEVLFDFNDEGTWSTQATAGALADGWSLGVPARLAAVGDPRTAWGARRCQFGIRIEGDRQSALSAQSRLARWLLRPDGWVMFHLDPLTRPVWLRMLGADPGDLSFEMIRTDGPLHRRDTWLLSCAFDADPFLYGERVTLPTVSLSQDVAGSPWFETPVVEGDAASRLRVEVAGSAFGTDYVLAGLPTGLSGIHVWQAGTGDGFTAGADTTAVSDAQASGDSWRSMSFATNTARVTRVSGTAPTAPAPGLYRALVRGALVDASGNTVITSTLSLDGATSNVVTWRTEVGALAIAQWYDYGLFQLPRGSVSLPDLDLTATAPTISFAAGRAAGTATAQVDTILLLPVTLLEDPAEAKSLRWTSAGETYLADTLLIDGDYEVGRALAGTALVPSATAESQRYGGWPEVVPGRTNTIVALNTLASISGTCTVTASYMPRWLYLPGEGS